jgi:hypothetical protein
MRRAAFVIRLAVGTGLRRGVLTRVHASDVEQGMLGRPEAHAIPGPKETAQDLRQRRHRDMGVLCQLDRIHGPTWRQA